MTPITNTPSECTAPGYVRALEIALGHERERCDNLLRERDDLLKKLAKRDAHMTGFVRKADNARLRAERAEAELDILRRLARGDEVA